MQTAIAFALIRLGRISDRRRLGTGPAPRENIKTNLHNPLHNLEYHDIHTSKAYEQIHCTIAVMQWDIVYVHGYLHILQNLCYMIS